ncbi:LOB domain-containing protein 36-like [Andrographis paniculata]|uniref:LOB domain-containing protein 36-like n=1 Tax=Andrographis paniculata TaxID=175694 RepID=UPI0021E874C3|nr:LOB domain-containing protein 36-like [Andrographis paniculata]
MPSRSSGNPPCAACKCQRRKCTPECVFAPYFPPDNTQKFMNVHKVFGASNVSKILQALDARHRQNAVNSLAYEAESRLQDPVYGCVGFISELQRNLKIVTQAVESAKMELATYVGPSAMFPDLIQQQQHQQQYNYGQSAYPAMNTVPMATPQSGQGQYIQDPQQQYLEAQQSAAMAAAAAREQEMFNAYIQQQNDLMRYNSGFIDDRSSAVTVADFNQMPTATAVDAMPQPSLQLGSAMEAHPYHQFQHSNLQESTDSNSYSLFHSQSQPQSFSQFQIQQQDLFLQQLQQQQLAQLHAQQQLSRANRDGPGPGPGPEPGFDQS